MPDFGAVPTGDLEQRIGYRFKTRTWLEDALTHSSLLNEPAGQGRRANVGLSHVGDAVLELAVREELFRKLPDPSKEPLAEAKKPLVGNANLARLARELGLSEFILRGAGQAVNATVLAEAFEAVLGAVFLDSDYETAADVVRRIVPLPSQSGGP